MRRLKDIVIGAVIAAGLMGLSASSAFAIPVVSIEPPVAIIAAGSQLDLDVVVDDVLSSNGILFFGFNVNAPATWTSVATAVGPDFIDVSGAPYPQVAGIAFSPVSDGDGIGGNNVLLATLSYVPNVAGKYTYSISGNMRKQDEGLFLELNLDWVKIAASSQVCVTPCIEVQGEPNQVPEPGTISLLGFGLLTLAGVGYGYSRKIRRNIN